MGMGRIKDIRERKCNNSNTNKTLIKIIIIGKIIPLVFILILKINKEYNINTSNNLINEKHLEGGVNRCEC